MDGLTDSLTVAGVEQQQSQLVSDSEAPHLPGLLLVKQLPDLVGSGHLVKDLVHGFLMVA